MSRHHTRRPPKTNGGFSWGRFPMGETGIVAYRLFRRDHRGSLHMQQVNVYPGDDLDSTANELRIARKVLRDRVDEIDLVPMGVAA